MNLDYFKDENLKILFEALKEKYYKTSKLTGVIKICPQTEEETRKIGLFLGRSLKKGEENIIRIKEVEKSLIQSKFHDYNLGDILNFLYGSILTKQEIQKDLLEKKEEAYQQFINTFQNTFLFPWLKNQLMEKEFLHKVKLLLNRNSSLLYYIITALLSLPAHKNTYENLSIFASKITKDPHYFDLDTSNMSYLLWFLSQYFQVHYEKTRASELELLNLSGIYVDNYSNFVLTYQFHGEEYLENLSERKEVVILNLDNILKLNHVFAKNQKVIILENPSLLSTIVPLDTKYAYIITSGNPNIAFYKLLEKLENHTFYYNGDFDPEGLLIADKLKKKYPSLNLIGYEVDLFLKAKSEKILRESRLKKLEKVREKDLQKIKKLILETKRSGYQEKIMEDLKNIISHL